MIRDEIFKELGTLIRNMEKSSPERVRVLHRMIDLVIQVYGENADFFSGHSKRAEAVMREFTVLKSTLELTFPEKETDHAERTD